MSIAPYNTVFPSYNGLDTLLNSLNNFSTNVTDASNNYNLTVSQAITNYMCNQGNAGAYATMAQAITKWITTPSVAYQALYGRTISDASAAFLTLKTNPAMGTYGCGLRVQIIQSSGWTAYDSAVADTSNNFLHDVSMNQYKYIATPKMDFAMTVGPPPTFGSGKWLINENQNTRPYNIGALLSNSGTFYYTGYSPTVTTEQMYLAVRQGNNPNYSLGNVVISMNIQPVNITASI